MVIAVTMVKVVPGEERIVHDALMENRGAKGVFSWVQPV